MWSVKNLSRAAFWCPVIYLQLCKALTNKVLDAMSPMTCLGHSYQNLLSSLQWNAFVKTFTNAFIFYSLKKLLFTLEWSQKCSDMKDLKVYSFHWLQNIFLFQCWVPRQWRSLSESCGCYALTRHNSMSTLRKLSQWCWTNLVQSYRSSVQFDLSEVILWN